MHEGTSRQEIISRCKELENDCREARKYSQEFYEQLLDEYEIYILALKSIGDDYPYEQIIDIQELYDVKERRLTELTDDEFEEYVILGDFLTVLLK